ncbi:aspartate-alanine antiporter-like transporter [Thermosipho ferrireducens]|uniref:aspartate-alanine antiporter-like transporter n=1 Tax=Thermosipho ferrireducens TaxID=2571116 RepID=UPI001D193231|nr:hypothetical protein [Thermosipho ferrireducens]
MIVDNPFFLLFLSMLTGILLGKIRVGNFKLGNSGALFSGLIIGWYIITRINDQEVVDSLNSTFHTFFIFSLILFISSVGLIASKNIKEIVKRFGVKFMMIAFFITFFGFIGTYFLSTFYENKYNFIGIYSGALTSSPGLATAIESAPEFQTSITYGYSIGYIPGVLAVIFAMYFIPVIFKIDIKKEKENLLAKSVFYKDDNTGFDFISYMFVIITGILVGKINIGAGINFNLGITGGVLLSSLILGAAGKLWIFDFRMNYRVLKIFQEFGLLMFLASVGLKSGYRTFTTLNFSTFMLMLFSLIIAFASIFVGYLIGRYIFKMNWIILSGAVCGGMTSTPGLGAAIDANDSEEVVAGYGATYPFALLGMVVFNKVFLILLS